MKKSILICGIIGLCLHLPGQTFNSLIANGGNKKIEWKTSTSGNGYGHKIYNFDPGGKTLLKIAARHNSSSWTDLMTFTSNGKIGIGTTNPKSKFHLYDNKLLASAANSSHLLTRISGRSSNTFMNNVWLRRDAAGSSWLTTRLHDGISIDASYLTPGTNTKTWWERDPYNNVQSWGNAGKTYMTLRKGQLGVGAKPVAALHVHESQTLGSANNNSKLLTRISGISSNIFMNNVWLRRDAAGSSWLTARLHDGISIDVSFLTPGTNTKTWWERDPYNNIQSWGNAGKTYMTLRNGNLGVGTTNPGGWKLAVNGKIRAKEVRVETGWSDFVFDPDYELSSLEEVEKHIQKKGHLKGIPNAEEVKENGILLGEMNAKLLQKIEELTLYTIAQEKVLDEQHCRIVNLEKENKVVQSLASQLLDLQGRLRELEAKPVVK